MNILINNNSQFSCFYIGLWLGLIYIYGYDITHFLFFLIKGFKVQKERSFMSSAPAGFSFSELGLNSTAPLELLFRTSFLAYPTSTSRQFNSIGSPNFIPLIRHRSNNPPGMKLDGQNMFVELSASAKRPASWYAAATNSEQK